MAFFEAPFERWIKICSSKVQKNKEKVSLLLSGREENSKFLTFFMNYYQEFVKKFTHRILAIFQLPPYTSLRSPGVLAGAG